MPSQTVRFEYDESKNILFVEDDYEVNTEHEVNEFIALYEKKLKEIGKKVYIVASIDGLKIGAKVYVYYGKQAKEFSEKWCLGLARWGSDSLSRMTVRAASSTARLSINLYNSKEAAVKMIDKMQEQTKNT